MGSRTQVIDLNLQSRKVVAGLNPATPVVEEEEGEESEGSGDPVVNAALDKDKSGPRCAKGGKRHDVSVCSTNMEKVKCYKCGKAGHISLNCRVKTGDKDVSKGSSTGKSGITSVAPSTSKKGVKGSGKGTGKSGGKKGKMFAMVDDSGTWCRRVPQPSKPTWVSVQDVVLNSLRPSTQPSQLLPELSHFYQTHKHKDKVSCSCRYGSCWCVTP